MPTVEAIYLSGISIFLEDCEIVGDVMAKIAIARADFATHIVVIHPTTGNEMEEDQELLVPRVEFVIISEVEMNIGCCLINLRHHAAQRDQVTCSKLLEMLRERETEFLSGRVLCDIVQRKKGKWRDAARTLIDLGVNVRASGNRALIEACYTGDGEVVNMLLRAGAEVNGLSEAGFTPLREAASQGHAKAVQLLLAAGAEVNSLSKGVSALMSTCYNGYIEVVQLLLAAGAEVNGEDDNGATALHGACYNNHAEVVRMLLAEGAEESTAIVEAASQGLADIVRILLAAKVDVNRKSKAGITALMKAAYNGRSEVVQLLLTAGADVDDQDQCGDTALNGACYNGHVEVVRLLLAAGADVSGRSKVGFSTLVAASSRGHAEIVQILSAGDSEIAARVEMLMQE